jgi:hypothetical protein
MISVSTESLPLPSVKPLSRVDMCLSAIAPRAIMGSGHSQDDRVTGPEDDDHQGGDVVNPLNTGGLELGGYERRDGST